MVAKTGYSRFPVLDEGVFIGYVHIKDVLETERSNQPIAIDSKIIRRLAKINATDSLRTVLTTMQRAGSHMALVADSKNIVLGVVTLEDALEELVGEILDEGQKQTT